MTPQEAQKRDEEAKVAEILNLLRYYEEERVTRICETVKATRSIIRQNIAAPIGKTAGEEGVRA